MPVRWQSTGNTQLDRLLRPVVDLLNKLEVDAAGDGVVQVEGYSEVTAEVEEKWRALNTNLKPHDYGALGRYRVSRVTPAVAAGIAANAEILQFRWTSANRLALVTGIWLDGVAVLASGGAGAGGVVSVSATIARAFTADGTGGATATLGTSNKLRTSMSDAVVGSVRITNGAALGVGTKTLDADPIGSVVGGIQTAGGIGSVEKAPIFQAQPGDQPIVLTQNEGFAVTINISLVVWIAGFTVEWIEVEDY